MDALRTVILKPVGDHTPAVHPVKVTDVALFGRDSVMTTAPKMVNGVRKLSLGIPSSEAGVSRSQCTLTVHQGSSLGQVSDAMTPASPTAGKSLGSCAVLQVDAGAKNAILIRRGPSYRLLNPGKQCALHDEDVIEFDTWRPRSERKFTYLATFAVSAQDQAAMKPSISSSASSSLSLSPAAPKGAVARSPNGRKSTPTKTPTKGVAKISSFFSPSARTSSGSAGDAGVGGAKKKAEADDDVVVVVDSPAKPAFRKMQHQQPETIVIDSPCKKANATAAAGAAAASSATTTTIAGTSATAAAPASGGDGERCVPYAFAVGSIVSVKARLGPGQNKPGGVARILKVSPPADKDQTETYDVKYILGGSERNLPLSLLSGAPADVTGSDNDSMLQGQENNGIGTSGSGGASGSLSGSSPNDKFTPSKSRLSSRARKGTSPLTQHKDLQQSPSPSSSSSSPAVVVISPNDIPTTIANNNSGSSGAGKRKEMAGNSSISNSTNTVDGEMIGLGDVVEVRITVSDDKHDGNNGVACWTKENSSSSDEQGRWAPATVVALPASATNGSGSGSGSKGSSPKGGNGTNKWTVALHGLWVADQDDVIGKGGDGVSKHATKDDDDDDDDDDSPREAVPTRMVTIEVPALQTSICLRKPKQMHQQKGQEEGSESSTAQPLALSFVTAVTAHATKRRRLGRASYSSSRPADAANSADAALESTGGATSGAASDADAPGVAAAVPAASASTPVKKRRKLPTPFTNALLKDLDGGHFPDLAAAVRDAGSIGWRATTRFTTDGLKAMYPCSEEAERKHTQLRKTSQRVIASDVVLNRLTLHQSPPLNNTTHGGSGGNVDGLPRPPSSSSATCAGQEPPPGGVQSLAELEAALEGLLETAPLSSSSTTTASSSTSLPATATPTPATAPSSAAKLAALISCGQLALSSLAACWGRDALWHLLARSTVRDRPAAEGLIGLATEVLSKHGARTCHSRMSGDVFTVDACTVAAQCLGLLAAVRGPDALREPLRHSQAQRHVPTWASYMVANALATFHAQFNAQEQAASSLAAAPINTAKSDQNNGHGDFEGSANELEATTKKTVTSALPLPSGCFKPPSLNVANALQLAH